MKILKERLNTIMKQANIDEKIKEEIMKEQSVGPFNDVAPLMAYLVSIQALSFGEYNTLRKEFSKRNKYLHLYDMAPRTFGETWGENYIHKMFPNFIKASKKNLKKLDPNFDGEYDLWLHGIHVEVKACRANEQKDTSKSDDDIAGSLASRAYSYEEAKKNKFEYHFQQIKVSCCDVFVFLGACKDKLLYWVLTSDELVQTKKIRPQHRTEKEKLGDRLYMTEEESKIYEGQVFMTEEELGKYCVEEKDLEKRVEEKRSLIERLKVTS